MFTRYALTCFTLLFLTFGIACDHNDGPMEKLGEDIDTSVENTKSNIEDIGYTAEENVEEAGDEIEDAAEETADKIEDNT